MDAVGVERFDADGAAGAARSDDAGACFLWDSPSRPLESDPTVVREGVDGK
jgi:hypothetical protein